jgi:purine-nucleoside phosphorylase
MAVVLGSGLGPLADGLTDAVAVPFAAVPGLPQTSVEGHKGCLTLGMWSCVAVLVFEGRLHRYEGRSWEDLTRPLRLAAELGVKGALLTNAAGGIREDLGPGSLMVVRDHIDWTRPWAWRLPGPGGQGPRRPSPYASRLRELLARAAKIVGVEHTVGVYAALTGPCYETPAEIRALRTCGADAVGMSIAREVEAGVAAGLECAAVSCITNRAAGLTPAPLNHDEVLANAGAVRERLGAWIGEWLRVEQRTA